jgi:transcriptional regulator with XRE-family HTH domain
MQKIGTIIGEFLFEQRMKLGRSQREVAAKGGLCRATLWNVENTGRNIETANLDKILSELGVSWTELGQYVDTRKEKL